MNWGTKMQVPPLMSTVWMHTPRPKPWKIGMMDSILCPTTRQLPAAAVWRPQGIEVQVAQQDALGGARGAAAVENSGGVPGGLFLFYGAGICVAGLEKILPEGHQLVAFGHVGDLPTRVAQ